MNSSLVLAWQATPPGRRRRRALWAVLGMLSPGCVLDTDDRCGPNQVSWEGDERCVCAEGTAYTPAGCVPCGANEVASAAGCVCAMGYGRSVPTDACAPIPEGIGTPCTSNLECLNPSFPSCQISPAGDGYCTTVGCAAPADCSGGYACELAATPTYCRRPPSGAGRTCTSDADCAGAEATYCDLFVSRTCLVQACTVEPDSCFTGSECCDLTPVGLPITLCIPPGACIQ
jgi:hypothetical protein